MAELIASHNLCHAVLALAQTELCEQMAAGAAISEADLRDQRNPQLVRHLLRYLAIRGVLEPDDGSYALTDRGMRLLNETALANLGFYLEAYGHVAQAMPLLLTGEATYGKHVLRDGEALARHCDVLLRHYFTAPVLRALQGSDATFLLDLGCGGGELLIDMCRRRADFRGMGLDISPEAVALARERAAEAGLGDRLAFIVGDAFRPDTWPSDCRQADAISAIGVMHEHFRDGDEAVIHILNRYAALLRDHAKTLILGEPELLYSEGDADLFLVHAFTNQGLPRGPQAWLALLARTDLECRRMVGQPEVGPRFTFYELTAR
jgi:SAM-dependent methyltransferase